MKTSIPHVSARILATLAALLAFALTIHVMASAPAGAVAPVATASAVDPDQGWDPAEEDAATVRAWRQAADLIQEVENVPAGVLARGDEGVVRWFRNQQDDAVWVDARRGLGDIFKIAKCGAAIAVAVGSTVFAAAKILKIKKLIKAAGGIKSTAKRIIKAFKKSGSLSDKAKAGFGDLGSSVIALAVVILDIDTIQDQCG